MIPRELSTNAVKPRTITMPKRTVPVIILSLALRSSDAASCRSIAAWRSSRSISEADLITASTGISASGADSRSSPSSPRSLLPSPFSSVESC